VLAAPTAHQRSTWRARLGDRTLHRRLLAEVPCFHAIDERPPPAPRPLVGWVRVAARNMERGRRPVELAGILEDAVGIVASALRAGAAPGRPHHVPLKPDWILVRGLQARGPAVVPVRDLSDHRLVSCEVHLP
jgi:hypothetical protein